MNRSFLFYLPVFASLAFASPLSQEQLIARGGEVSAALVQKLGSELKAKMEAKGPLGALTFCSQNAMELTHQVAVQTDTAIKRISLNNRNAANIPTQQERMLLEKWETSIKNGQPLPPYELISVSDSTVLYYKPIVINNEACLKCHGNVEGELAKAIRSAYPEDKATGYKMGDLRGMIAVEIKRQ